MEACLLEETREASCVLQVGDHSLADRLSGGDLDGDEFAVIWERSLVRAFPSKTALPAKQNTRGAHPLDDGLRPPAP